MSSLRGPVLDLKQATEVRALAAEAQAQVRLEALLQGVKAKCQFALQCFKAKCQFALLLDPNVHKDISLLSFIKPLL